MELSVTGKTALITGGSLGLGRAMGERLYASGANVALVARRLDVLEETQQSITEAIQSPSGGRLAVFAGDVSDVDTIKSIHSQVEQDLGPVDILVNNAGKASAAPFMEISDAEWQDDLELKLFAAIRMIRAVWPGMQQRRWGRIINILNTFAKTPSAKTAPTSVSRAAGMALTKVLANEGAADNILVNALLIGLIKSDQMRRMHEASGSNDSLDKFIDNMGKRLPMGRLGESEECANLVLFLASDAGSYITGSAINMDGGLCQVV